MLHTLQPLFVISLFLITLFMCRVKVWGCPPIWSSYILYRTVRWNNNTFPPWRGCVKGATASPWSEESLSAGELSSSSIASGLWPRRTLTLGWLKRKEPCCWVVEPFLRPRSASPVQCSWGPLSALAAEKICKKRSPLKCSLFISFRD